MPGTSGSSTLSKPRLRSSLDGPLALAASVPAPVLGKLLGYCDDTANHWRRAAAGDWARYASLAATPTT
jgi:hypothetical protein